MRTFIQDCIDGKATAKDVHDYVDKWHNSASKLSLHNFLGFTTEEYVAWVADENILNDLISKYNKLKNNKDFNPDESAFDKIVHQIEGHEFIKASLFYLKSENERLKKELDFIKEEVQQLKQQIRNPNRSYEI